MPKLKILCVVEGATISNLLKGDIVTLANGTKFTVVSVGEAYSFFNIPVPFEDEFEDEVESWFYEDLRHYHNPLGTITRVERWFTLPTSLFDTCDGQIDTGVIIATID